MSIAGYHLVPEELSLGLISNPSKRWISSVTLTRSLNLEIRSEHVD